MAELGNFRKVDLKTLAYELGVDITPTDRIIDIIEKIEGSPKYNKRLALDQIAIISEDRKKEEAEEKEKERNKLESENERERIKFEREEAAAIRAFELEKLRLAQVADTGSVASGQSENRSKKNLKSVMQIFDPEKSDMALFLTLFQRQAKKIQVPEEELVTQLLALLPVEIAEIILREPEECVDDFESVKKLLLNRFKLSPEAFRTKFVQHQRRPGALWKDLIFELRSYLEGWLEGIGVEDFEALKKLMIADQIKRRAPPEIKEHLIDQWVNLIDPQLLASKLDEYEAVRKSTRKITQPKFITKKFSEETRSYAKTHAEAKNGEGRSATNNWRDPENREQRARKEMFERRKGPVCFNCQSPNHLRYNCPELKNKSTTERINNINIGTEFDFTFAPYLSKAKINNVEMTILRDSGSSCDLLSGKYVQPDQMTGEVIWLKQPLDNEFRCLPIAKIEMESVEFGRIFTKAAVVNKEVQMNHYLLGNQTQELIEEMKEKPLRVNAVVTRGQIQREKISSGAPYQRSSEDDDIVGAREEAESEESEIVEPSIDLPPSDETGSRELLNVNSGSFRKEQSNDESLISVWEKARKKENSEFYVEENMLFRRAVDHRGSVRKQLVIPVKFRNEILSLCHEDIAAHLGATKTKDKLLRYYFWPNIVKDAEEYVRTCDPCQKVGKAREKKKAPLKLVPIIREIFTKINIDTTGPLPLSEKNNRYILTAMCMASKYPEALPIADIGSESVTDALLVVFSRIGFPREIQCDLGSCFTSNLTTTFFEKFGIKITHSSVRHPESNPVERWHRSVKRLLKVLCLEQGTSWEKNLPAALLALRTVTHESTGFSPAELVHGKNLRTPETLLFEHWVEPSEEGTAVTEYVFELINRLKKCQDLAIKRMEEMQIKRKKWYDKGAVKRKFKPGDQVLVIAASKPNKLAVNWIGPGIIESQLSDTNYIVRMPGKKERSQIFHVNLLKPYHKRVEIVNLMIHENCSEGPLETDLDICYPIADPNIYDFEEIVRDSELQERCTPEQITKLEKVLSSHKKIFSNDPGRTDMIEHDIKLISNQPVRSKPYRTSPRQAEILKREIKRMLDLGIIEIGESDYTSPMILVEAPGKDPRPCIDYRKLNSVIRAEYFPLPNIEERVEKVAAAKYITVIDLTKGYWQIPLSFRARRIAAFITNFGVYRPLVLPFGLMNGPFAFSKFMSQLLQGCEEFCVPYLDDIAVFSETWDTHLKHLDCVLRKIAEAKLTIKPSKCKFAQSTVKYLGHVIGNGCRTPAEVKIQAVLDFPAPKNKTEIRRLLGMTGYYSRYIKNYAIITEPLTRALKGKCRKETIEWTKECENAFAELKEKLTQKPVLYAPDYSKEFVIQTDASDKGIGVIMAQRGPNKEEHPILYLSRKFTQPEIRYGTTEKECSGIIFAIKKLRPYLDGQQFIIETDHNPLVWLKTNAGNNPRLMRWALALQPFNYTVIHRPGKDNKHADCLSRID